ncbi:MAG: helix-turn-helix transcriptional regulator [Bacteroidales bacterium]|jgi:HTH-type transcriptional regulator/antitoxin HipB|nr:helix-turn-helix transcriptional regulator [Bacteroidales bacterium]
MKANKEMKEELKQYSLDEITDEIVGKVGTDEREQFEFELKLDLLGDIVKQTRLERHLTQEQLGKLIGVKKAQISKIENNIKDVRFSTIMKVFNALKAKIKLSVELDNTELNIA